MPSLGVKSRGAVKKDVRNRVLGLHREVCAMGIFMGKNFSRRRVWREQWEGRARGDSCVGAWSGGSPGRGRADSGSVERPRLGKAFEPGVRTSADEVLHLGSLHAVHREGSGRPCRSGRGVRPLRSFDRQRR